MHYWVTNEMDYMIRVVLEFYEGELCEYAV